MTETPTNTGDDMEVINLFMQAPDAAPTPPGGKVFSVEPNDPTASERTQGPCPAPSGRAIYVASRASQPARPAMWRKCRELGVPINSTWIDEAGEGETKDQGELWGRILAEVTSAERLVLYAEPEDFPLKGAYVEVGMALAAGVPVYVVAPEVPLCARTYRPLGSWAAHPLVTFAKTVAEAFVAARPDGAERVHAQTDRSSGSDLKTLLDAAREREARLRQALNLVRMSLGWQHMSAETRAFVARALSDQPVTEEG